MSSEKASAASDPPEMPQQAQLEILPWHDGDYYFQTIFEDGLGRLKGGEPRLIHQWKELQLLCGDFWTILGFEEGLQDTISMPILVVLTLWKKPDSVEYIDMQDYSISYVRSALEDYKAYLGKRPWAKVSQPLQRELDRIGQDVVSKGDEL